MAMSHLVETMAYERYLDAARDALTRNGEITQRTGGAASMLAGATGMVVGGGFPLQGRQRVRRLPGRVVRLCRLECMLQPCRMISCRQARRQRWVPIIQRKEGGLLILSILLPIRGNVIRWLKSGLMPRSLD
ncbi:hypothetical protein C798_20350 [Herbaspirillum rubrisubalbicans Os34]|uniref:Uncharacterized protein n=1 Tax=Herbaspirillum rubrisubalbicans Os34 TaxID=1235827 RepID=A0A6M3ZVV8_9BURK|nr:hypothetical protein C798_20350 [Herbaspirillum rubrisubalbicans Os34]